MPCWRAANEYEDSACNDDLAIMQTQHEPLRQCNKEGIGTKGFLILSDMFLMLPVYLENHIRYMPSVTDSSQMDHKSPTQDSQP